MENFASGFLSSRQHCRAAARKAVRFTASARPLSLFLTDALLNSRHGLTRDLAHR